MALSELDRDLLQLCLARKPQAWERFVDRFLGLVLHVVSHSSQARGIRLDAADREDLAAEVFLGLVADDFTVLRRFRGESSLATYLTVIARRIVVRGLLKLHTAERAASLTEQDDVDGASSAEDQVRNREEIERLLDDLTGPEAAIVRLFHLEGKSYQQIASEVGVPENSIGPTLTRARAKMRRSVDSAVN